MLSVSAACSQACPCQRRPHRLTGCERLSVARRSDDTFLPAPQRNSLAWLHAILGGSSVGPCGVPGATSAPLTATGASLISAASPLVAPSPRHIACATGSSGRRSRTGGGGAQGPSIGRGRALQAPAPQKPRAHSSPSAAGAPPRPPPDAFPAARPAALLPLLLPLATAMAKLQHDPKQLLGWKVRLTAGGPRASAGKQKDGSGSQAQRQLGRADEIEGGSDGGTHGSCARGHTLGVVSHVYFKATSGNTEWHGDIGAGTSRRDMGTSATPAVVAGASPPAVVQHSGGCAPGVGAGLEAVASPPSRPANKAPLDRNNAGQRNQEEERQHATLQIVRRAEIAQYGFEGTEEYIIQLDDDMVPYADVGAHMLLVDKVKAAGMLAQGHRHLLLQLLQRELAALAAAGAGVAAEAGAGAQHLQASAVPSQDCPSAHAVGAAAAGGRGRAGPIAEASSHDGGNAAAASDRQVQGQGRKQTQKQQQDEELEQDQQQSYQQAWMPSRQQLLAAGRRDLVDLVAQAGGFAEVALRLGLRCSRRPRGYWAGPGSWGRLAAELAAFVAAGWMELPSPDHPGRVYYYNQVSGRTTWRRPPSMTPPPRPPAQSTAGPASTAAAAVGQGGSPLGSGVAAAVVEPPADRVMPAQSVVLQAKRYDLNSAVLLHGGYSAVAAALGRRVTWKQSQRLVNSSPAELQRELAAVARDLDLPAGVMPTQRELQESGHGALLVAVRRCGGFQAVAGIVHLTPRGKRRPQGHWDDLGRLAEELAQFAGAGSSAAEDPHQAAQDDTTGSETAAEAADRPSNVAPGSDASITTAAAAVCETVAAQPCDGGDGQPRRRRRAQDIATPPQKQSTGPTTPPAGATAPPQPTMPVASLMVAPMAAATASGPTAAAQETAMGPPAAFPSRQQLRAAGRQDLVYALQGPYRDAAAREKVARLAGLAPASRRGTNRNALSLDVVIAAIQAGCSTPAAIRTHLASQGPRGVDVSRQHLTAYLRRHAQGEGAPLVRLGHGVYSTAACCTMLPGGPAAGAGATAAATEGGRAGTGRGSHQAARQEAQHG